MEKMNVKPAEGKLGVLCVGLGAVATTFMTGVLMTRKGLAKPVGSMTQYDKIRVGRGEAKKYLHYNEIVPMAKRDDIVFGAWDVQPANAYESAINCEVLREKDINPVKDELEIRGRNLYPVSTTYSSFGAGVQTELDGDEKLSYNEAGGMVITGFNQKLEQLNLIVGTVSDHLFTIEGQVISLTELCGKNAAGVFRVK